MSTMHDETKTIICKNCGAKIDPSLKFCKECWSKTPLCIAEEKAEAERIAKERKEKCRAFFKKYKFVFLGITLLLFGVIVCEIAKAGDEFSVAGIDMVRIPDSAEYKGLYFGKYEVTQAQWQAIMGNNPSFFTGDSSRPVEQVSWNECQEFIKKLNARAEVKQAGLTFFLPTSELWKYACRAGSTGKYDLLADGREGSLDEMGWYEENSGRKTHPVGQKKPNAWGLYDMHGNVWEWTASKDDSNDDRFCCGGSWYNGAENCEADYEIICNPDFSFDFLGFRLAAQLSINVGNQRLNNKEEKTVIQAPTELETIKVVGIEMVRIPDSSEHKGLYFGKYEVTQAQWQAIIGNNPSFNKGDLSRPVELVSWNECQEFIKKLNARAEVKQAGLIFFLPTEEQWEYACRAGSTGDYGLLADGLEGTLDKIGWYNGNSRLKTHPVGQKKPNAWGLYDMHGNVWEWTASENDNYRIYRGGCWNDYAGDCEADYRNFYYPDYRYYGLGFRLAASRIEK